MEQLRADQKIKNYGIASWTGFRVSSREKTHLQLHDLMRLAERVGGSTHGLRYLSFPLNIVMMEALLCKDQAVPKADRPSGSKEVSLQSTLRVATDHRLNVITSSPFLSGFLLQTPLPATEMKSRYVPVKHLNLLRYSLGVTRSIPADCIKSVAVGQKKNRHTKINMQLCDTPPVDGETVMEFLSTPKKRAFDSLIEDEL
jgi:hypothetical protein